MCKEHSVFGKDVLQKTRHILGKHSVFHENFKRRFSLLNLYGQREVLLEDILELEYFLGILGNKF